MFLEIEKASKISIEKRIYYDDELERPQVNLPNFIENNIHNVTKAEYLQEALGTTTKFYFLRGHITAFLDKYQDYEVLDENGVLLQKDKYGREIIRRATNDEVLDIIERYKKRK